MASPGIRFFITQDLPESKFDVRQLCLERQGYRPMNTPSDSIRDLARRLLAMESANGREDGPGETERAIRKLRVSLSRFAGRDGFSALLKRALVLSRAEMASLADLKVTAEGDLEGLENVLADEATAADAGILITAHLLWLLVTFIGEPLTLQIVRDAWPDVVVDD